MADFGDEMGEKLVRGIEQFLSREVSNATSQLRREILDGRRERKSEAQALREEAAQKKASSRIGDAVADEVERQAAAGQEGQQLIDVAYKLEDLVGMPEGYDPADAVSRLKGILDGKLEERMCGALMNWEYDVEQGLLRAQVAADSLDTVTGCLREAADELSDAANLDSEHAAEAERLEQEGKLVSPERTSFELDLDEAHIPPEGRAGAWRELREAFSKTALAPCAQVDLVDGKVLKVRLHTDDAEAVNEAARELAELSRQEGAGAALELACDKISLSKKVNIRCMVGDSGVVAQTTASIPAVRREEMREAVRKLKGIVLGDVTVRQGEVILEFRDQEHLRLSLDAIEQADERARSVIRDSRGVARPDACKRSGEQPDLPGGKEAKKGSPYIDHKLLSHAKEAARSISDPGGPVPPPPRNPRHRPSDREEALICQETPTRPAAGRSPAGSGPSWRRSP